MKVNDFLKGYENEEYKDFSGFGFGLWLDVLACWAC
jgi:hypothetical protein